MGIQQILIHESFENKLKSNQLCFQLHRLNCKMVPWLSLQIDLLKQCGIKRNLKHLQWLSKWRVIAIQVVTQQRISIETKCRVKNHDLAYGVKF